MPFRRFCRNSLEATFRIAKLAELHAIRPHFAATLSTGALTCSDVYSKIPILRASFIRVINKTISHYRILKKLGSGGMGVVYEAEDTKLRRLVALKFLSDELARDTQAIQRFQREARAASALNHPNICVIYEIDEFEGQHFIAMELLNGQTLGHNVSGKPLKAEQLLELSVQIADALDAAHTEGIIHRDIKPANIFVTARGQAKILDFGLAKLRPGQRSKAATAHQSPTKAERGDRTGYGYSGVVGTLLYMSPEQARGEDADVRSDLFSFGAVLYEMATGKQAYSGATPALIFDAILNRAPDSSGIYPGLNRIINRAVEKDRSLRYQSASDLRADLQLLKRDTKLGGFSSGGGLVSVVRPPAQKIRKPQRSLAVLPFVNGSGDPEMEYLSDGMTDSLINCLSQLSKLRVVPRTLVFRYKGLETDLATVGRDLDVTSVLTGRIARRGDTLMIGTELSDVSRVSQLWGAQFNRKFTDIFAVQEEIAHEISERLRLQLTGEEKKRLAKRPTHDKEAYEAYLKGSHFAHKLSPDNLARAIEYARLAIEKDPRFADAYTLLAYSYSMLGTYHFLPPAEAFPKAKAAALRALELDEMMPGPHVALGVVLLLYDWKWSEAEKEVRRALELSPDYAFAHQAHGVYLLAKGKLEEALAAQKQAVELDPLSPTTNLIMGAWFFFARQYHEAIEQLRKTLELEPNLARARRLLARAHAHLGNFDEAIAEHHALDAMTKGSAPTRAVLAYIHSLAGRRAEAEAILDELRKENLDLETRYIAAAVYAVLGKTDEAFELLNNICDDRYPLMIYVTVDPVLDPLRTDPRFRDLLKRVDLLE
jgi:serine/threonine protein kinase/tetratricopeptide (TPR) repeat protein